VSTVLRKGRGEPLVFLHGIGGGGRSFQRQVDALSDQFDCIAWDVPGYGGTALLPTVTFETISAALAQFLDDLKLSSVHLVGHSLGGMIAQDFVARYPARVRSLILSCTSPAFGRPDGDFQKQFIAARLDPLERGMTMEDNARELMPSLMPAAAPGDLAMAIACMAEVPIPTYRAIVHCLVTFDRRASLPDIAVPTLVLATENDRAAPAQVLEKMASKIPGARYVCLPQVGHLAYLEDPEAFSKEVRGFVAGVQELHRRVGNRVVSNQ
jgi:3-oxoadipate enol-lactonase